MATDKNERENELKTRRICRFCLTQAAEKLSNIYSKDSSHVKSKIPLSVQVMACVSIEIFFNDGMPTWICSYCRALFEHGYRFKQMCKHAETTLRQYPLTGKWPIPLAKPHIPAELLPKPMTANALLTNIKLPTATNMTTTAQPQIQKIITAKQTLLKPQLVAPNGPKKILNSNPVDSPEPPVPVRFKKEKMNDETSLFLAKVENDEELSMDDVQRLIAATDEASPPSTTPVKRPKILNKSSIRILNKEADMVVEPRLSQPQIQRDEDGNVAIVSEVLDPNTPYKGEPDPVKNAEPVETDVFPCPHCERSFPLRQLRDIHMVNHNRERRFQCVECEKSFFSKYDLMKHNLVHTAEKPFKCSVCERAFTRATLLHRHEKSHTDIPKYICVFCEKQFISKEEMEKHTERHRKKRPFKCRVCQKAFAFKQGLERHEVVHGRNQPYPCLYCKQSFSTPSKLARHLTAHAGKRPYPCKFCSKSYLLSHHLTRHLRSHKQGQSQFNCNDCNKVYHTRDELIFHSAVHANETLCCALCKKVLKDAATVTAHVKEHAESEMFACEFCDLIFISASSLQGHIDESHADDLKAYHEDEQSHMQNMKQETIGIDELEEDTIEELLMEELPTVFKKEPSYGVEGFKPKVIDIDSLVGATDKEEEKERISPPTPKVRKINNGQTTKTTSPTATQLVRKVAAATTSKSPVTTNTATSSSGGTMRPKQKIQIEDQKIISPPNKIESINSVLKALPKSVSVRKRGPASSVNASTSSTRISLSPQQQSPSDNDIKSPSTITLPQKRTLRTTPRRTEESTKGSAASVSLLHNKQLAEKNAANASTGSTSGASEKVVKMMIGDKKVKVHKITISRAEADAMAKDGRISIKDGNMILTQAQTSQSDK